MFYFNWYEILGKARKDQTAILILTFAQTSLYNPYTTKGLMKALKINHIPLHLFTWVILEQKKDSLVCHYKTQEPMSYINNMGQADGLTWYAWKAVHNNLSKNGHNYEVEYKIIKLLNHAANV